MTNGQIVIYFIFLPCLAIVTAVGAWWESRQLRNRPHRVWIKQVMRRERAMHTLARMQSGHYQEWLKSYGRQN